MKEEINRNKWKRKRIRYYLCIYLIKEETYSECFKFIKLLFKRVHIYHHLVFIKNKINHITRDVGEKYSNSFSSNLSGSYTVFYSHILFSKSAIKLTFYLRLTKSK